jgi:hypothetical protein
VVGNHISGDASSACEAWLKVTDAAALGSSGMLMVTVSWAYMDE